MRDFPQRASIFIIMAAELSPLPWFSVMRVCITMCYDVGTDRFHVTVSLAAGREVSGPRRLAHNDIGSLTEFVYINVLGNFLRPDLVQMGIISP